ncbi:MAG: sulfatase [Planctomycetaceae bacterium]
MSPRLSPVARSLAQPATGWSPVAWLLALAGGLCLPRAVDARPPNVIVVLVDDLGWRDLGVTGNRFIETPHLDRLARRGLHFTCAYANAPNCSPTRACLMSGQYTPRHGVYTVVDPNQKPGGAWQRLLPARNSPELPTQSVTLAESLRDGGYATAFFGMWNLGRGRSGPVSPGGQGFDKVVFPDSLGFGKDAYRDSDGNYLSDRLTDEVLRFIEQKSRTPFFVYFADHAVHAPFDPRPDLLQKYTAKRDQTGERGHTAEYAATVEAVDQNMGRLVEKLEQLGLVEETLLIFTSDNGGTGSSSAPLRGNKGQLYEGGIRVPLLLAGAGVSQPGREISEPVLSLDLYPTVLELAGLPTPAGQSLDGRSLAPLLAGAREWPGRDLFWHFPCYAGRGAPSAAIRSGEWKLIEFFESPNRPELYDLAQDPGEQRNLAVEQPGRTRELLARLKQWQEATGALLPSSNPDYDATAQRPRGGAQAGGRGRNGAAGETGGRKGRGPQGRGAGDSEPRGPNRGRRQPTPQEEAERNEA